MKLQVNDRVQITNQLFEEYARFGTVIGLHCFSEGDGVTVRVDDGCLINCYATSVEFVTRPAADPEVKAAPSRAVLAEDVYQAACVLHDAQKAFDKALEEYQNAG